MILSLLQKGMPIMKIVTFGLLSCLYFYMTYVFLCVHDFSKYKTAVKITIVFVISILTYLSTRTEQYIALSIWSGIVLLIYGAELLLPQMRKGCLTIYKGNIGKFILFCVVNGAAAIFILVQLYI